MSPLALSNYLDRCVARAERLESNLGENGEPINEIGGFCGLQTRHLWNALGALPGVRYLEVGVLHGATLLSFAYGNEPASVVGVDSFVEGFGGQVAATRASVAKWGGARTRLVERDCWTVPLAELGGPFDVFYYDGGHSRAETAQAFSHFLPVLAPTFLMLVDDYSWPDVQAGVADGIGETPATLKHERCLGLGQKGDELGYWNGVLAAVFSQ